jgi:hypothetical protein
VHEQGKKPSFQLTVPKPVAISGAYGGKPVDLQMGAVILQKGYVGFYLMCIYMNDATKKKLSPALLKLLKGKACFHVKTWTSVCARTSKRRKRRWVWGTKVYRERGWL